MVRTPSYDKNGIKKGAWSPEEDRKLQAYINKYGHWNWRELPKFAGLKRCGKSCRLRWMNYLRPDLKRGNYAREEEDLIMELHQKHGNKWAMIASKLPGRTDNEIKNYWHTHLKKRWMTENASTKSSDKTQRSSGSVSEGCSQKDMIFNDASASSSSQKDGFDHIQILESCPLSPQMSPTAISFSSSTSNIGLEDMFSSTDYLFFDEFTSPSLFDPQTSPSPFDPQTSPSLFDPQTINNWDFVEEIAGMLDVF